MRVTKMFREMRQIKGASPRHSRVPSAHRVGVCRRCGGFLVDDHGMDLDIGEGRAGYRSWAMHCVQCGDLIDETILRNRYTSHLTHQVDLPLKTVLLFSRIAEQ